jgi:hypothetical protein
MDVKLGTVRIIYIGALKKWNWDEEVNMTRSKHAELRTTAKYIWTILKEETTYQ